MAQDDDTAFRPRPGRIRSKGGAARGRTDFLAAVALLQNSGIGCAEPFSWVFLTRQRG
ncbi:MAG: hypothetical protein LKE81_07935 [Acetobacter sp.]|nr:hypothetical protein [Acetobacter sp.]MCH4061330.1 hypothetical protein [Acetobacter sp.]MCH4088267.1 hypothetical protein [Acetobacter sp.]